MERKLGEWRRCGDERNGKRWEIRENLYFFSRRTNVRMSVPASLDHSGEGERMQTHLSSLPSPVDY